MNVICSFFFKQKTAYEMRISDWSSDVCSSDLGFGAVKLDQPLEVVGQFDAMFGEAGRKGVAGEIMCVPQVIGAGNHGEDAAGADDTDDRTAAKADAVIAGLAPEQADPLALTDRTQIGEGDLDPSIPRIQSQPGEEYPNKTGET